MNKKICFIYCNLYLENREYAFLSSDHMPIHKSKDITRRWRHFKHDSCSCLENCLLSWFSDTKFTNWFRPDCTTCLWVMDEDFFRSEGTIAQWWITQDISEIDETHEVQVRCTLARIQVWLLVGFLRPNILSWTYHKFLSFKEF